MHLHFLSHPEPLTITDALRGHTQLPLQISLIGQLKDVPPKKVTHLDAQVGEEEVRKERARESTWPPFQSGLAAVSSRGSLLAPT